MKPKEKAEELLKKMYYQSVSKYDAKQCALIAVDEIIKATNGKTINALWGIAADAEKYIISYQSEYWQEVKQEIEKL